MRRVSIMTKHVKKILKLDKRPPFFWKFHPEGEECMLSTGAKIFKHKNRYYLFGYAEDGSDVKGYLALVDNPVTQEKTL